MKVIFCAIFVFGAFCSVTSAATRKEKCADKSSSAKCAKWEIICWNNSYVQKRCQKTCGYCTSVKTTVKPISTQATTTTQTPVKTTQVPATTQAPTTTRPSTTTTQAAAMTTQVTKTTERSAQCNDEDGYNHKCQQWKNICKIDGFVRRKCPSTCGVCNIPKTTMATSTPSTTMTTTKKSQCSDEDGYGHKCQQWKNICKIDGFVRRKCPSTCGVCNIPKTTIATSTPSTTMTTSKKPTTMATSAPVTSSTTTTETTTMTPSKQVTSSTTTIQPTTRTTKRPTIDFFSTKRPADCKDLPSFSDICKIWERNCHMKSVRERCNYTCDVC